MNFEEFRNPSVDYRIKPFWFWNGEMEFDEITRQIGEMAEKGIGGFFICPRQGLKIPYLSEQWFDRVKFAVETAKRFGLEVWLYDEFPYPSGISGGEVVLQLPESKMKLLKYQTLDVKSGDNVSLKLPWSKILLAMAIPIESERSELDYDNSVEISHCIGNYQSEEVFQQTGLTSYNTKRYFSYGPKKMLQWLVPKGEWKIIVFLEEEISDFKYFGTYVDPCNDAAVKKFIETTHMRYLDSMGEYFGSTIKGIFTDEVHPLGLIPYSEKVFEFFYEKNAYKLTKHLPALFDTSYRNAAKIRYEWYLQSRAVLKETYHHQISDWCSENNIQFATEVPSFRMTNQNYSHIPGSDSCHEKLGKSLEEVLDLYTCNLRSNPKQVSSLARQLGKKWSMVECFHSVGWSMTLMDAKWMLDRLAAFGINLYNFHAFFYTIDGLTKHDAPPSQFLQNPYWKHFRVLADYAGRLGYIMSESVSMAKIAVLDPITSLWTHLGNPLEGFRYGGEDPIEKSKLETIKQDWVYICKSLLLNQIDYDHIDAEILVQADLQSGKLVIGNAEYSILILPPITNIESFAWNQIKKFIHNGGIVIALGLLPYEEIELGSKILSEVWRTFGVPDFHHSNYWESNDVGASKADAKLVKGDMNAYFLLSDGSLKEGDTVGKLLVSLIQNTTPSKYKLEILSGNRSSLLMNCRKMTDDSEIVFISNQEETDLVAYLATDSKDSNVNFEILDIETGEAFPQSPSMCEECARIKVHFRPFTSILLRITRELQSNILLNKDCNSKLNFELNFDSKSDWEVNSDQNNVLRLGKFAFKLDYEDNEIKMNLDQVVKKQEDFSICNYKPITNDLMNDEWSLVETKTLIEQCADLRSINNYKINFVQSFGTPQKMHLEYPVMAWYRTAFYVDRLPQFANILMDSGAISGDFIMYVNGNRIKSECFLPATLYDHKNIHAEIKGYLQIGLNHLTIRIKAERDWDGLVDPIYITGDFGVYFLESNMPLLGNLPKSSQIKSEIVPGYPYFSGTLNYKKMFRLTVLPEEDVFELSLQNLDLGFHECVEILINGHSLGVRAWNPYIWSGRCSLLKSNENTIEVRVTNTLINMLEGKYFDFREHVVKEVESRIDNLC